MYLSLWFSSTESGQVHSVSNIYVSYNHLQDTGVLQSGVDATIVKVNSQDDLGLNAFQYPGNDGPHLHLEVFFDLDGNLVNGIRINPILFFDTNTATTIAGIIQSKGPYYPLDSVEDGTQFEWPAPDTSDPATLPSPPFDGVDWNNRNNGTKQDAQAEDLDLGIRREDNNFLTIVADKRELAAGANCTFVWARTDQQVRFRYGGGPGQSCDVSGTQQIGVANDGYDGIEWLADRWVLGVPNLIALLSNQ